MENAILNDSEQLHQLYLQEVDGDLLECLAAAMVGTYRLANIGSLTAGITQELSSPLSVITSACSNLLDELRADPLDQQALEKYVQLIERSAFRSAHIVKVLQNYVYMDKLCMAVTNVNAILRDSLALVQHQFLKKGDVEIEIDIGDDSGSLVCDHNRITQVLVNLLFNAYEAMKPQGGTMKITFWTLRPDQQPQKTNGAARSNGSGKFAFAVTDSGHGIDPAITGDIFKPFFTTRTGSDGIGLGLFIARAIVQQHNGHIWVENNPKPARGATSTVILPVRP